MGARACGHFAQDKSEEGYGRRRASRALTLSGGKERRPTTTERTTDMTPVLYGEIRVILRENEVKTFRWRVERERERESGKVLVRKYPEAARREGGRERWRIMAPLRNENCMETRKEGRERGEEGGKQLLPPFLPTTKNCAVKNAAAAAYVFGKVI